MEDVVKDVFCSYLLVDNIEGADNPENLKTILFREFPTVFGEYERDSVKVCLYHNEKTFSIITSLQARPFNLTAIQYLSMRRLINGANLRFLADSGCDRNAAGYTVTNPNREFLLPCLEPRVKIDILRVDDNPLYPQMLGL